MFTTHPPWRHHFNHMGGHLPIEDHVALPRSCQAPLHSPNNIIEMSTVGLVSKDP